LRLNRSNSLLFQSFTSNILRSSGVPHANTTIKDLNYLKKYQASWPTRSHLASSVPARLALLSITMPWWTRPRRRVWLPRPPSHQHIMVDGGHVQPSSSAAAEPVPCYVLHGVVWNLKGCCTDHMVTERDIDEH
jgi:hypothetical protein